MKKKGIALILLLALLTVFSACTDKPDSPADPSTAEPSAPPAVSAYTLDSLGNADDGVQMLVLLKDGWIMDVSLGMLYTISPGEIEGIRYEAVSDTVFVWKPDESVDPNANTGNVEMRIIYADPQGRFAVYSPNVENPDMANIIMNPDCFADVVDVKSKVTDKDYRYFYKIKDRDFLKFSKSLSSFPGFDDYAVLD